MSNTLKPIGFLRLPQIIGQSGITDEQAESHKSTKGYPKRSREAISPILPISATSWWNGVKSGKYPKSIKLGPRTTVWRASEVFAIVTGGGK